METNDSEERQKNREKYSDKLWELANLVTGFAIAQSIATTFAVAGKDLKALKSPSDFIAGMVLTVVFALLYGLVVRWCYRTGAPLGETEPEGHRIWRVSTYGRIGGIFLFNLITFMTFAGGLRKLLG